MRQIDFNEEKKVEKLQRAMSKDKGVCDFEDDLCAMDYVLISLSGEHPPSLISKEMELRQRNTTQDETPNLAAVLPALGEDKEIV